MKLKTLQALAARTTCGARMLDSRLEWQRDVDLFTEQDRERFALTHELRALDARKVCNCGSCKTVHGSESMRCGNYRVCVKCRGHRASELRARFLHAQELSVGIEPLDEQRLARTTAELTDKQRARRAKAMRLRRASIAYMRVRGGRERFLTLTFPDTGDPSADVLAIYEAWPRFARALRLYLVNSAGIPKDFAKHMPFVRVVEVTPGQTGGHVHLHIWTFAPFLPHVVLRQLWARALPDDARARLKPKRERLRARQGRRHRARGHRGAAAGLP